MESLTGNLSGILYILSLAQDVYFYRLEASTRTGNGFSITSSLGASAHRLHIAVEERRSPALYPTDLPLELI